MSYQINYSYVWGREKSLSFWSKSNIEALYTHSSNFTLGLLLSALLQIVFRPMQSPVVLDSMNKFQCRRFCGEDR